MRFGTLIPHFGEFASPDSIVRLSHRAEALGFGSLWVRDHLIWDPHGMEGTNRDFLDPFMTLAAAAAVTERCVLGTAVTIPVRWPLKLAQEYATLSFLSGGRVVAGLGLGFNPKEFAGAGFRAEDRERILEETIEILRAVWSGETTSYQGQLFQFEDVQLRPAPIEPIPILYGGTTPAGVRRAARLADGWYCGRLPMTTLDARLALLEQQTDGRTPRPYTVIQPLVVIDHNADRARRRVPIEEVGHSSEGARFWKLPPSGSFSTVEDLAGLVVCGTPDDIVEQMQAFVERGVDEVVFDFRLQFDEYEQALELVGADVLPRLGVGPVRLTSGGGVS